MCSRLQIGTHLVIGHSCNTLQRFLDRVNLRTRLTGDEQRTVLGLPFDIEQVNANHDFVHLGQQVHSACFVAAGFVGQFDQTRTGARQITAIYLPGDMPDLHSVVQTKASSALQALTTATVLHVPHAAIRLAIQKYPAIGEAMWRECTVDSAILAQWVVNVGRRDGRSRIAHLLCELVVRIGGWPEGGRLAFDFEVTQAQLSDATGLTPVHVNRVLKSLRDSDLVILQRRVLEIGDWAGLVALGDFDARYLQGDLAPEDRLRISALS